MPMKLAHTTLAELPRTGDEEDDSRVAMLLQSERAGVDIQVTEDRLQLELDD